MAYEDRIGNEGRNVEIKEIGGVQKVLKHFKETNIGCAKDTC